MQKITMIGALLIIAGCAGREPQPVAVVGPTDQQMGCDQILAEIAINNQKISDLAGEEDDKVVQNVVAGAAGLFIPVLWFGMDFQDAAGKEAAALSHRNQYLATLAGSRCPQGSVPPPVQPS